MREAIPFSHAFPVNFYVLYRPPDNSRLKMQMLKAGPYIVVSVLGDKYSIQDLLTHKVVDIHATNLSEFRYDPTSGLNPTEVAARNAGEFFVDKIVDHTGNVRRRSDMTFRVRWEVTPPTTTHGNPSRLCQSEVKLDLERSESYSRDSRLRGLTCHLRGTASLCGYTRYRVQQIYHIFLYIY